MRYVIRQQVSACVVLIVLFGTAISPCEASRKIQVPDLSPTLFKTATRRVEYGSMLIVSSDAGAACIVFHKGKEEVRYRFRYQGRDGKSQIKGSGVLFERYSRVPAENGKGMQVLDRGSQLHIKAGPFDLDWSENDDQHGWIYFCPAGTVVRTSRPILFDRLDLTSYIHKNPPARR